MKSQNWWVYKQILWKTSEMFNHAYAIYTSEDIIYDYVLKMKFGDYDFKNYSSPFMWVTPPNALTLLVKLLLPKNFMEHIWRRNLDQNQTHNSPYCFLFMLHIKVPKYNKTRWQLSTSPVINKLVSFSSFNHQCIIIHLFARTSGWNRLVQTFQWCDFPPGQSYSHLRDFTVDSDHFKCGQSTYNSLITLNKTHLTKKWVGLSLIRHINRFNNRQNYYRYATSIRFSESNSKWVKTSNVLMRNGCSSCVGWFFYLLITALTHTHSSV